MVYSMTGFGRSEVESGLQKVLIEMKAVNHRYCDIALKIPKKMTMFEERIKQVVKQYVNRGRVEIYLSFEEQKGDDFTVSPNFAVLDQYADALKAIQERYNIDKQFDLGLLTKFQDVFTIEYKEVEEEEIWNLIEKALLEALNSLMEMRRVEGQKLLDDIHARIDHIKTILKSLADKAPEIVQTHKEKMKQRIQELLDDAIEIDEIRLAQEVAYFSDKTNITEELVRLSSHLEQLYHIFDEDKSIGRKLDFLLQEINREINTIGSKSPDVDISNFVIDLKSEFEKIREQIQNIE
ncbi:MAG: YicC family protein [Clostridia bacterium]|nr:YicC family protein [Clostridia bacterium]